MDPKLKRLFLNSAAAVWVNKYGLYLLVVFLAWFLGRWHFREFESQIHYQREIITPDELYWVLQSLQFRHALIQRDWHGLVQSAHPGIITMWLGSIGTTIKLWLNPELQEEVAWLIQQEWVLPQSGELSNRLYPFLAPGRNALRWLVAGLWLAIFQLLRERLASKLVLFFTLFILITDMWIVGLTNILHVDGLLALFCTITLLLVLPKNDTELGWYSPRRYILAGCTLACAILSKVPGLVLLGIVPAVLIGQQLLISKRYSFASKFKGIRSLGLVLLGCLGTFALLAPIVFIDPAFVFDNVFVLSSREIGFTAPTFFFGRVTENPGALFYPLTILFRQQIFVTIGLIILVVQTIRNRGESNNWIFAATSILFSVLFLFGLLISDREFARYAIPIFMVVSLVGAISVSNFVADSNRYFQTTWYLEPTFLFGLALVFLAFIRVAGRLDPFVFTNPLVGGNRVGPRLMLTTWGSQHSSAAAFSDSIPGNDKTIFTDNIPGSAPFVSLDQRSVFLLTEETARIIKPQDIVILSRENQQLNPERWQSQIPQAGTKIIDRIPAGLEPEAAFESGGQPRVSVYSNFDPETLNLGLTRIENNTLYFGAGLAMLESTLIKPDDDFNVYLYLRWKTNLINGEAPIEDGKLKLSITDQTGHVWVEREDQLIDIEDRPSRAWTVGREYLTVHALPLASDMPPENFQINASYFSADGSLTGIGNEFRNFIGVSAELASLQVELPDPQPPVAIPEESDFYRANGIQAVNALPAEIGQGERFQPDIWVRYGTTLQDGQSLTLNIGSETLIYPLDTTGWQDGYVYRLRPEWRLPADFPPGTYPLKLNGIEIGETTVRPVARNFELDTTIKRRNIKVGDIGQIHYFELNRETNEADLVWELKELTSLNYTLFIHLLDENFNILHQSYRQPGRPTSQTVANEILSLSQPLPPDLIAEAHYLVAGLQNPSTGVRLPVTNLADGTENPARHIENALKEENE